MKDADYLWDEMRANLDARPFEGDEFAVGFSVGWRAAMEAAHARAEAKAPVYHDVDEFYRDEAKGAERARYWANPKQKPRVYWACRGEVVSEYVFENGDTAPSEVQPKDWTDREVAFGWIPCTTEAEARRVAGFADKGEANAL